MRHSRSPGHRATRNAASTLGLFVLIAPFGGAVRAQQPPTPKQDKPAAAKQDPQAPQDRPTGKSKQTRLPPVIVRAAPDEASRYRTPSDYGAARDVIGPREVRESGAQNAQELLRRTPSIYFFEETGTDSKPNIAVRGVTSGSEGSGRSANVSLLADGVALAPAPYGHAGQSLFPFTLERVHAVDVIRGGHTVRYGPNTVSGVINFLTRPIPEETSFDQRFRYNSFGDFSSYTGVGGTYDEFGYLLEAVYKTGETYRHHGDYTIENYALKTSYDFSHRLKGLFQVEYFEDDSDLSDGLSLAAYRANPKQSLSLENRFEGDQTRGNFTLDYKLDESSNVAFSGYVFGGDRTFYLGSPRHYGATANFIDATPRPMTVWGLQAEYTSEYDFGGGEGELVIGVRHHQEDVTRKAVRYFPAAPAVVRSHNRYDYYVWSAWIENSFRFDRLLLTPGVRVESVDMDGKNRLTGVQVDRDFVEVLPALSGSYRIDGPWHVYANVQSSFLPPQANHIEISSNPQNLEAQYAWTYEVGTRSVLWEGLLVPDLTAYWIDYEDRIERDPAQFNVFVNRGNTRHRGFELTLDSHLGALDEDLEGLSVACSASFNDSEYVTGAFDGNDVPHAPQWMASWDLRYAHQATGLWCGLGGFYVDKAFSDSNNTMDISADGTRGRRPSYSVWNVRGGYDKKLSEGSHMRLQVGVNNLLDEDYFEVRAGRGIYPGPPQGVYANLNFSFIF